MGRTAKKVTTEPTKSKSSLGKRWAIYKNTSTQESADLFAAKITTVWQNEIRKCGNAIESATNEYNSKLIELEQKTTEYKQAYNNSFLDFNAEDIETVDMRANFVSSYETKINRALNNLNNHLQSIESYTEQQSNYIREKEAKITSLQTFLSKLNGN